MKGGFHEDSTGGIHRRGKTTKSWCALSIMGRGDILQGVTELGTCIGEQKTYGEWHGGMKQSYHLTSDSQGGKGTVRTASQDSRLCAAR